MPRHSLHRPGAPPRMRPRKDAAHYVGVCPALFDRMVRNGTLPQPIRFGRRKVWDLVALDRRLDELSRLAAPAHRSAKTAIMEAIRGAR